MSSELRKIEEHPSKQVINKDNLPNNINKEDSERETDDVKEQPKKNLVTKIRDEWQLIARIIELAINALCLGLFYQPASKSANFTKHHLEQVGLLFLTFSGYLVINAVFIISRLIKDRIPFRTISLFSIIAAVLNFVAALLLIVDKKNKFQAMYYEPQMHLIGVLTSATVLCFVNTVVYGLDGVYTFLLKKDY
ncbi:uncharacterized protein LOC143195875 [Rhynchophorus ferrugineus]|uniref:DUF7775 domain-containing protein n=1 Tax=Rhynchophorus ferrugineus TaxID=354439 RepID=A0A834I7G0_RHYFE|nr:hypothetical protein GWI33_013230 [Rhynchophorus ferrugineus]